MEQREPQSLKDLWDTETASKLDPPKQVSDDELLDELARVLCVSHPHR